MYPYMDFGLCFVSHTNNHEGIQMSDASNAIYEASVFSREVHYRNLSGEARVETLHFALDPLALLQLIAGFNPKGSKSGDPRRQNEISDEDQVKFVRKICVAAAGWPAQGGEVWEPFPDFENTIAGKTFLTKLTTSNGDREEFAQRVLLDPFRAFVDFAAADSGNTPEEVQKFRNMLKQLENVFAGSDPAPSEPDNESPAERRIRLRRELAEAEAGVSSNPDE